MPWWEFLTIIVQSFIGLILVFFGAAILSVVYNNFNKKD